MANNPNRSYLIIFISIVILALLSLLALELNNDTNIEREAKLCGSCHQMQPQLYTWHESAHQQVACSKCHPDSSVLSMFLRNRAKEHKKVITVDKFITDGVCLDCHTQDRTVTPPNGLVVSHGLHLTKGVDCNDCHRDMAHAQVNVKVLEPGLKSFENFTQEDAKKLVAFGNLIPMDTCMKCHNGTKAPDECAACHQNKPIPVNHAGNWKSKHGEAALKDLDGCNFCHEYDVEKQQTAKIKHNDYPTLQTYARSNEFCIECHKKRPPLHTPVYSVAHNKSALTNKEFCFVCHNWSPNNDLPKATSKIVCSNCHVSITHPKGWVNIHKDKAKSRDAESCFSCHDQKSCTNCHTKRGVNLAD